jgi:hypothetical protein
VILSSSGPNDVTYACCYFGSPINKLLHDHCKPYFIEVFTHAVRLPKFSAEIFPRARAIVDLPGARTVVESAIEPPHRHSRPRSRPLYAPPSSSTRAGDTVNHAGAIPKPAMPFPSSQQRLPPQAREVVHPVPFLSPRCHRPASSPCLQCCHPHRACDVPEPATPLNSRRP